MGLAMRIVSLLVVLSGLAAASCDQSRSDLLASPDPASAPARMGLAGDFYWADLKAVTEAHVRSSWYGDGLGMGSVGLAHRWARVLNDVPKAFFDLFAFEKQISEFWESTASRDIRLDALSPAEKHDWLMNPGSADPGPELRDVIASRMHKYRTESQPEVERLTRISHELFEQIRQVSQEMQALSEMIQAKQKEAAEAKERGELERSEQLSAEVAALQAELGKKGLQITEISKQSQAVHQQLKAIRLAFMNESYPLLPMIELHHPLLFDAWNDLLRLATQSKIEWGWFGHCHGAAAAGLYEPRTQNAVLLRRGERQVMFFQKDIRDLMVKAWADQAPDAKYFAGRRCYQSDPEKGANGRVVDGAICTELKDGKCRIANGGKEIVVVDNQISSIKQLRFRHRDSQELLLATEEKRVGRDLYRMRIGDSSGVELGISYIQLSAACRDVNAMSFHLALTEHLAKGRPIVIDGSQEQSVWNAAISGFNTEFLPIQMANGELSQPGQPVAVEQLNDPFKDHRAPGTKYLVAVRAHLAMHSDYSYSLHFINPPGAGSSMLSYNYTLELDGDQKLIGGEWGGLEATSDPNYNGTPDFIWFFPADRPTLKPGLVDLNLLATLRDCSQARVTKTAKYSVRTQKNQGEIIIEGDAESEVPVTDELVPYVECSLPD
jgi:hypothetical protein